MKIQETLLGVQIFREDGTLTIFQENADYNNLRLHLALLKASIRQVAQQVAYGELTDPLEIAITLENMACHNVNIDEPNSDI